MADQKAMWNRIHGESGLAAYGTKPSEFALKVGKKLAVPARLLELGCGEGGDAAYFAGLGCKVTATDFSEVVIERAKQQFPAVDFQVADMARELPFGDNSFDAVYANLSLHYADDAETRAIFGRIARVLTDHGQLFFRCKSIHSESEKAGAVEIAPDIYDKDGHLRHLFSTDYVESVTQDLFTLERNEYTQGDAYGHAAYFIEVEAVKR